MKKIMLLLAGIVLMGSSAGLAGPDPYAGWMEGMLTTSLRSSLDHRKALLEQAKADFKLQLEAIQTESSLMQEARNKSWSNLTSQDQDKHAQAGPRE